jgi:hypothetical protein
VINSLAHARARHVLIAVLAFLLTVAFAFAASAEPASAARDVKQYSVTPRHENAVTINAGTPTDVVVTFKNEGPTNTQRAGAFFADFGAMNLDVTGVRIAGCTTTCPSGTASGGQNWVVVSGQGDDKVVISAFDGGNRIGVGETVSAVVTVTGLAGGVYPIPTGADQEHHGDFNGGSAFDQPPRYGELEITVVVVATSCKTGDEDNCDLAGSGFTASLTCGAACSYLVNTAGSGLVADITINTDGSIYMKLTTTGKGPSPGNAYVQVEYPEGSGQYKTLPSCGTNGPPTCSHIYRVSGNHTEYEVFWNGDPRLKFG